MDLKSRSSRRRSYSPGLVSSNAPRVGEVPQTWLTATEMCSLGVLEGTEIKLGQDHAASEESQEGSCLLPPLASKGSRGLAFLNSQRHRSDFLLCGPLASTLGPNFPLINRTPVIMDLRPIQTQGNLILTQLHLQRL